MNPLDWLNSAAVLEDGFAVRLTQALVHFLWQGAALGLLALSAAWGLRRRSARLRYGVHVAALMLMLACLPVTFALVGPAVVPEAPRSHTPAAGDATLAAGVTSRTEPLVVETGRITPAWVVLNTVTGDPITAAHDERPGVSPPLTADAVDSQPEPSTYPPLAAAVAPYAAGVYLLGVALMLLRLMLAVWGGHRLRRSATPVMDAALLEALSRQARRIGMRAAPAVAWCGRVSVPIVVGVLRPMILLPGTLATGLNPSQLESLLTHELAHIRRYDLLVNVMQRLVEALLFYHPAVWYVSRRISIERENCCDDAVLDSGCERVVYADALVRMAELCLPSGRAAPSGHATVLAASGGGPSQFKRRVLRVLGAEMDPGLRMERGTLLVTLLLPVGLLLALATLEIRAESETNARAHTASPVAGTGADQTGTNRNVRDRDDIVAPVVPAGRHVAQDPAVQSDANVADPSQAAARAVTPADAPAGEPVDAVTEQLFRQYVVSGGKIPSASVNAAIELVAARGGPAFHRTVLAEFEKSCDDENRTVRRNLLKLISKLLAREGAERWRYERARRTGEVDQSATMVTQRPSPANDKLMYRESELLARVLARGRQADRHDIDEFVIAVRQAHHPQGKRFLLDVLRNPLANADADANPFPPVNGARNPDRPSAPVPDADGSQPGGAAQIGNWPDNIGGSWYQAKFLAAVGLAELGEPAGVEWLLQQSERNDFGVGSMSISLDHAPHAQDARGNLRESSLLALADLFELQPTDDSAPFKAWWAANKNGFAPRPVALRID